jgi:RimJ/RimL family protein N-acetyltransferase
MAATTVSTDHGEYSYSTMPTNRAVAMCYRFKVFQKYQGQGHGHALKAHQMRTLASMGVRFAVCSTRATNKRMARVLERAGWERAGTEFLSPHTGHMTQAWHCHIEPQNKRTEI